ncbi:glycosyltransferase family 4 protein [Spirulina major CS-329]|uniref:glycosyltransferase family 4 protein n=1 Tax=Spirulina TaxID=1154 RepID=UPI00232CBFDA|nr:MULTISPECIES: glycosyltransferase family 4 protein [Spirulina]MDB9495537.1 glycosyltransferase family 4 protein [Spirulina subsalsa CS-330]MDB9505512.1 glycosyltransferase family 4 protein [Spirulina major CS-329]
MHHQKIGTISHSPKTPRLIYASGPCDAVRLHTFYQKGEDDPSHFAVIYTQQFFDICKTLNAKAMVISWHQRKAQMQSDMLTIQHWPFKFHKGPGLLYHLEQFWKTLKLSMLAILFRADAVIVVTSWQHFYILSLLGLFGIPVIADFHTKPISSANRKTQLTELIKALNIHFLTHHCHAIAAVSDDIREQVQEMVGNTCKPVHVFYPTYRRQRFAGIEPPDRSRPTFNVLFVGRIEENKGVYILVEIARLFAQQHQTNIVFDICGHGSQINKIKTIITEENLSQSLRCHGQLEHQDLRAMYNRSHVVIVPTKTTFNEGFNKVVLEAILSGRPVITSSACPALRAVAEAAIAVPPDDANAYSHAVLSLYQDRDLYSTKQQSALALQRKFYDRDKSWEVTLEHIIAPILSPP